MSGYMSFEDFRIKKINYEIIDEVNDIDAEEDDIKIKFNIGYLTSIASNTSNLGHLKVSCEIEKIRPHDKCEIEVTLEGRFRLLSKETDVNEAFLKMNGTAILMPYIRNIISMITGYDTTDNHLLLPTVNVQQLFEEQKD